MDPNIVVDYVSSFHAKCIVWARLGGIFLNGHWKEVHREHHPEEELAQQA
jgi:hypothetical protein